MVATCLFAPAAFAQSSWKSDLLKWRQDHAGDLQKPDGWLSLAGLSWLQPGDNTVGSAADNKIRLTETAPAHLAILRLGGDTVTLVPPPGGFPSGFQVAGAPPKEGPLRADPDGDGLLDGETPFGELPARLPAILARPGTLCHLVRYPTD